MQNPNSARDRWVGGGTPILYPTKPYFSSQIPIVCQMNIQRKHEKPHYVYSRKKGEVPPTIPVYARSGYLESLYAIYGAISQVLSRVLVPLPLHSYTLWDLRLCIGV